ncbi:type II toxin-antitoxin system PemK/MazF family toxin [Pseudomonas vanderleydeniana]|nr:type II toxin-antitoxin system PemK/MazF family toxin [Pseudomonas vanderleydeniana]
MDKLTNADMVCSEWTLQINVRWFATRNTEPRAYRMPLRFQPKEGSILICNFSGFVAPEMVKQRPVVILRKHPHNSRLVTVVPLSTTQPERLCAYHVELPCYLASEAKKSWAKCDMLYTVSMDRLDRIKTKGRHGQRQYEVLTMSAEHFAAIQVAVLAGLNLHHRL